MHITKPALVNMMFLLLWRRAALASAEELDEGEVEALAAARSAFSGQLDAIFAVTELVCAAATLQQDPAENAPRL